MEGWKDGRRDGWIYKQWYVLGCKSTKSNHGGEFATVYDHCLQGQMLKHVWHLANKWVFPRGYPNSWLFSEGKIMENPTKMNEIWGYPYFRKPQNVYHFKKGKAVRESLEARLQSIVDWLPARGACKEQNQRMKVSYTIATNKTSKA